MPTRRITQPKRVLKSVDELVILEDQTEVSRHLQVLVDKPCVATYFSGKAWPEIGERGNLFYALTAELKRIGLSQETAKRKLFDLFSNYPEEIKCGHGQDGRPFTQRELESIIKSAYKKGSVKSYGCNSGIWDKTCIGPEICQFKKLLSGGKEQSPEAVLFSFVFKWLGKDSNGRKFLFDSDVRIYMAICAVEKRRAFKPGSPLFVSWRELSDLSGVARQKVGDSLMNLFWAGLISYQKGKAQQRGTASEINRIIPVPNPNQSHKVTRRVSL